MKRRAFLAASASLAATACAPGTTVDPTPSVSARSLSSRTIGDLGPVTLTVWDQEVGAGQHAQIEALNAQFQDEFPNVTVRRLSQSFDDLRKQLALALAGDEVPDVVQVNSTRPDMGALVAEGQLLNLETFAKTYGWQDRFPEPVLTRMRFTPDAARFGDGDLYGLPQTGALVGIYYRQATLTQLGAEPPISWAEFFDLLDAARSAGLQPMALGNLEQWPALHLLGTLQPAFVGSDESLTLALGNPGATWVSDGNVQALARIAAWGTEGYLGDSPTTSTYESAVTDFASGKAAFLIGGSWLGAELEEQVTEGLRFMAPPPGLDEISATPGGTGVPWAIPAAAANPEVAAAYLNFITSHAAMEVVASHGDMPVLRTAELAPEAGVLKDIFEAFTAVATDGVLLPYLDNATPTFGDTAGIGLQELLGGQKSPEDIAEELQADYAGFVDGEA